MSSGKLCVLVWFCAGPGPVLLLFRCWFLWRNANLAGGFAGRLVSWFLFAFLVVDCFFVTYFIVQLEPVRFSRLVLIRFYLLIPIAGPSLRATSAKPEEKKTICCCIAGTYRMCNAITRVPVRAVCSMIAAKDSRSDEKGAWSASRWALNSARLDSEVYKDLMVFDANMNQILCDAKQRKCIGQKRKCQSFPNFVKRRGNANQNRMSVLVVRCFLFAADWSDGCMYDSESQRDVMSLV